jgi:protein phosphatase 1 regulatory subunit 37
LNRHAAEALADVLTVEWGLSKLSFENGALETDDALKPILHALLISGKLSSLGLAGNRKLKPSAWRLVALFLRRVGNFVIRTDDRRNLCGTSTSPTTHLISVQ